KIADAGGTGIAALGVQGEICCRGYQNMLGYYRMPEATSETIDADGWLHMGDLGSMDERGFIKVTGRLKDMIVRGGMNIYPREIEELLHGHPAVAEAAVIGVPDATWGEQIAAIVRPAPGVARPTPDEMRAYCREQLAAHKAPLYWSFVDELPSTPTGKVQKFVLRDQFAAGLLPVEVASSSSSSTAPAT
ncbi:MAG: AMP-binding enzyme, partial [Sciscionella sp.]